MPSNPSLTPCIFVNHGGGPSHRYGGSDDPIKNHLLDVQKRFNEKNTQPKSILVLSAHNESRGGSLRISCDFENNRYDDYPAKGDTDLANRVHCLLKQNKISSSVDHNRSSLDHGALTPLVIAFPRADIPVATLSLDSSMSPQTHLRIGQALQPLREEGVLIIGSGMSFHNLGAMFGYNRSGKPKGYVFDQMLTQAVTDPNPKQRNDRLTQWERFPGARDAHPREEHLMPLLVCAGAAGSSIGQQSASFNFMGASVSGYSFPYI